MKELFKVKKGELVFKVEQKEDLGIRLEASYDGAQADAGFFIELSTEEYLEMLKELIPGDLDDFVIEALKVAIK